MPDTGNFANFVVPVVNAGATYCRRKSFRTVLGRKCRFVKQPSAVKCCNTFLGRNFVMVGLFPESNILQVMTRKSYRKDTLSH